MLNSPVSNGPVHVGDAFELKLQASIFPNLTAYYQSTPPSEEPPTEQEIDRVCRPKADNILALACQNEGIERRQSRGRDPLLMALASLIGFPLMVYCSHHSTMNSLMVSAQ